MRVFSKAQPVAGGALSLHLLNTPDNDPEGPQTVTRRSSLSSESSDITVNEQEANRQQHNDIKQFFVKITSIVKWFKIFGLRHSANHFGHRIWAIVSLCFSSAGFTLPLLWVSATVFNGPVSIFSEVLQKFHDSYACLCYLCLMYIFCSTSENYIFQHKNSKFHLERKGGQIIESLSPEHTELPRRELQGDKKRESERTCCGKCFSICLSCLDNAYRLMTRAFLWIIKKTFSFEGSTLLFFLGSWSHYVWWFASEASSAGIPFRSGPLPSGVFSSEEMLYVYLVLVATFPWRVVPPILATHLIVMNFKRFEKLAKSFYLNHRRQPHTPVIIGVVPTHFFSKSGDDEDFLRSRELSTHDLFFIDSVPESRSRDFDFNGQNNISLKIKLIREETKGLLPLWPNHGTSLKISGTPDFPVEESLKLPDLNEPGSNEPVQWTPFISVCTPGVKIRTLLTKTTPKTQEMHSVGEKNKLLFRSAYALSGFKKQDCKSCFEELTDDEESFLKKGDTHFYETAIMCDSSATPRQPPQGQSVGSLHEEAELSVEIEPILPKADDELYQPSTELMSQLVRNGLLEMKTFLRLFRILFWVMVLLPLINMILFILDALLGGNIKYVHLLLTKHSSYLNTLSQLQPRPLSNRPSPSPCFFHLLSSHSLECCSAQQRLRSSPTQHFPRHLKWYDPVPWATRRKQSEPTRRCPLSRQFKPAKLCRGYHYSHNERASSEGTPRTGNHRRAVARECSKTAISFLIFSVCGCAAVWYFTVI
jgi:hypothetical protein